MPWSEIFEGLIKTFGPAAGLVVVLAGAVFYLWRHAEKAKDDRIVSLEKALARAEARADTLAEEGRDYAEKVGEARAREARTMAEIVAVMRDAIADGREERRQYMTILDNARRDSEGERREMLEHIDRGNENIVAALMNLGSAR